MTSSSRLGPRLGPQEISIPPARPRVTAFSLGLVLTVIVVGASTILFHIPTKLVFRLTKNGVLEDIPATEKFTLAAIAVVVSLVGFTFLVSGNTRRIRLIYEFTASAAEMAALLEREDIRESGRNRDLIIEQISDYETALLRLGAYEQALQVSQLIAQNGGRAPYTIHFDTLDY